MYLIEILHQTTTAPAVAQIFDCCILSKFYIKPQRRERYDVGRFVVSYRNSTSNHNHPEMGNEPRLVVSYRNSTSNHNRARNIYRQVKVVSYRNSTSNHNISAGGSSSSSLYLIEILHQTTTIQKWEMNLDWLYLIEILHQTTTFSFICSPVYCCILSKFYIKPQPTTIDSGSPIVVSYRNSTSNHNNKTLDSKPTRVVSYRNSTSNHNGG